MKIIGLTGYARVGKDTAARVMQLEGWARFAFADALKREIGPFLTAAYRWSPLGPTAPEMPAEWEARKGIMRPLLVAHGAVRRAIDPDYWINQVRNAIREVGADKIVITDVRYRNEADWIWSEGGSVIYIARPGYGPANGEEGASVSDLLTDKRIGYVENDVSPLELGAAVLTCLRRIGAEIGGQPAEVLVPAGEVCRWRLVGPMWQAECGHTEFPPEPGMRPAEDGTCGCGRRVEVKE